MQFCRPFTLCNWVQTSGGAFHSTKFPENSGLKSNGTENFRKLISKISVNLSRLSFFSGNLEIPEIFLSIWHFYPALIGPSSSNRAWKLQDSGESILHWMQNDLLQFKAFFYDNCRNSRATESQPTSPFWIFPRRSTAYRMSVFFSSSSVMVSTAALSSGFEIF